MSNISMKFREKFNNKLAESLTIYFALLIVWIFTGLWHGADLKYLVYGLYYFVLMIVTDLLSPLFSKLFAKLKISPTNIGIRIIKIFITYILVNIGMLIFRAGNLQIALNMFTSSFNYSLAHIALFNYIDVKEFTVLIIGLITLITVGILGIKNIQLGDKIFSLKPSVQYIILVGIFLVIFIFGAYGLDYMPPDPIYGGF